MKTKLIILLILTTMIVPSKFTGPFFVQFNSTHFP